MHKYYCMNFPFFHTLHRRDPVPPSLLWPYSYTSTIMASLFLILSMPAIHPNWIRKQVHGKVEKSYLYWSATVTEDKDRWWDRYYAGIALSLWVEHNIYQHNRLWNLNFVLLFYDKCCVRDVVMCDLGKKRGQFQGDSEGIKMPYCVCGNHAVVCYLAVSDALTWQHWHRKLRFLCALCALLCLLIFEKRNLAL